MLNIIFVKKALFSEKTAKNCFGGASDPFFMERERLTQKINITFFYRELSTGYFIIKQVFRKKEVFSEKTVKNYL